VLDKAAAARHALARYSAAFVLDPHNGDAAVYAFSTLSEHREDLQKDGDLLERLRRTIFGGKNDLYSHASSRDDWQAIYRCHLVLAGIAETQNDKWGPPDRAYSVIFQLSRAQKVEKEHLREGPEPPAAWLDARLGFAYERFGDGAQAAGHYARAADGFLRGGDLRGATSALAALRKIGGSSEEAARLGQLAANMAKVRLLHTLPQPEGVIAVAFFPDGEKLLWGSHSSVKVGVPGGQPRSFPMHKWSVGALALAPDGGQFACAQIPHQLLLISLKEDQHMPTEGEQVRSWYLRVAYNGTGTTLAAGGADGRVELWDPSAGKLRRTVRVPKFIGALALSPDDGMLATGSGNNVVLWNAATGARRSSLEGHTGWVRALAFDPRGKTLASGGTDRAVRLWDAATAKLLAALDTHRGAITALAFSPDGRWLLTGDEDGGTRLWDVAAGKEVAWLAPFRGTVTSASFSPDGKRIAAGLALPDGRGEVKTWDVSALTK
jgi:hypothetical protein